MIVLDQTGKTTLDSANISRYHVRENSTGKCWTIAADYDAPGARRTIYELGLYPTEADAKAELWQIAAQCLRGADRYQVKGGAIVDG